MLHFLEGLRKYLFERLKLNNLIDCLLFALVVRRMIGDICILTVVLSLVRSLSFCFLVSGDDALLDRYDYLGYGSK